MRPASPPLELPGATREVLEALSKSATAPHREVVRAKALLLAAEGVANTAIGALVDFGNRFTNWANSPSARLHIRSWASASAAAYARLSRVAAKSGPPPMTSTHKIRKHFRQNAMD